MKKDISDYLRSLGSLPVVHVMPFAVTFIGLLAMTPTAWAEEKPIVHDAQYYILDAQNGREIASKLAQNVSLNSFWIPASQKAAAEPCKITSRPCENSIRGSV